MSEKQKFPLELAAFTARGVMVALLPFCERIQMAGSIRRQKLEVSDAELLYIPKVEIRAGVDDMFNSTTINLVDEQLDNWLRAGVVKRRPSKVGVFTWGKSNKLALHTESGMPIDFFATTAAHFWVSLVIRTGPKEFNLRLMESAKRNGLHLHAYPPHCFTRIDGTGHVNAASEREVLALAGMPWLEPEERF